MVKRIIATCASAFLAIGIHAESNYMTIEKINGSKISFLLADNPVITYKDGNLEVNKDAKTTYAFEDIKNYHFTEDDQSAAKTINASTLRIVKINDETIEVQNAESNSVVMITSVNGFAISKTKADANGNATVKMPRNTGVYILTAGNQSFKIIRK